MASYTYTQLYGTGSIGETISSGVEKVFTFTNPSGSSYFTMETIPSSSGFFEASSPKNFSGSFVVSESMGLVTSPYIASVVVQPGTQSFKFTPAITVTGTTYYLRGTGAYSLDILSFDPDAQAFITATAITDTTQQNAIDALVIGLKADSLWNKMLAVYPFVGGTAETCKFNLKNPLNTNGAHRLSFVGGWTFSNNGIQPNGTNTYANTHLAPSTHWSFGNSSISAYSRTNNIETGNLWGTRAGASSTTLNSVLTNGSLSSCTHNSNISSFISPVPTTSAVFLISSRISSTAQIQGINGTNASYLVDELALSPNPIYLSAQNQSGTPVNFSTRQLAFAHIGYGLTQAECTLLYNRIQTFQTTLGRQV